MTLFTLQNTFTRTISFDHHDPLGRWGGAESSLQMRMARECRCSVGPAGICFRLMRACAIPVKYSACPCQIDNWPVHNTITKQQSRSFRFGRSHHRSKVFCLKSAVLDTGGGWGGEGCRDNQDPVPVSVQKRPATIGYRIQ